MYTYKHPRPALSVDIVAFSLQDNKLSVLLIKRATEPFIGMWALPGGFVHIDEDIESAAERRLLDSELRSDVVVIPHHGSKTSSSNRFVAAVKPRWALLSVGYRNRFGLPKDEPLMRWRNGGATVFSTVEQGAVEFDLGPEGVSEPRGYREQTGRYWNRR